MFSVHTSIIKSSLINDMPTLNDRIAFGVYQKDADAARSQVSDG